MSFQFEDDSALEELLNQQLDRGKQPVSLRDRSQFPVSQKPNNKEGNSRPSTANYGFKNRDEEEFDSSYTKTEARPLSSWLAGKSATKVQESLDLKSDIKSALPPRTFNLGQSKEEKLGVEDLSETRLQSMSKQGLIQLINQDIAPRLLNSQTDKVKNIKTELEQVKGELEAERAKSKSLIADQTEQVQLVESRWIQLNRKLEERCLQAERKLAEAHERHAALLADLTAEHKVQLDKVLEDYKVQLDEQRHQFESKLRRKDELHEMEMSTKLKVNGDLMKLETVFSEWQQLMQSTIRELNAQYKSVENLLDKQTIEINTTNEDLIEKTKNVLEQGMKFTSQSEQLDSLIRQIAKEILPKLERSSTESQSFVGEAMNRLTEMNKREQELKERERSINEELSTTLKEANSERFQLGLESNRLSYERDRLEERSRRLDVMQDELDERRRLLLEGESELASSRASLEVKFNELKEQNYEVHLSRKKVLNRQEELERISAKLKRRERTLSEQVAEVRLEWKGVNGLRERTRKELDQLKRVQKSLLCSLCNQRLFSSAKSVTDPTGNLYNSKNSQQLWIPQDNEQFLAEFGRHLELDSERLQEEDRFVDSLRKEV